MKKLREDLEYRMGLEGLGFYLRTRGMCIRELEFLSRELPGSEKRRLERLIEEFHRQQAEKERDFGIAKVRLEEATTIEALSKIADEITELEEWLKTMVVGVQREVDQAKVVCMDKSRSGERFCPVIDVHAHNPSKEYLGKVGADYCWWLNGKIEQAEDYPWVLACFSSPQTASHPHIEKPPVATESAIREIYGEGYRGYGEFKTSSSAPYDWKPFWKTFFDEERFQVIYRTCGEVGMPILFHMEVPTADGYTGFLLGDLDAYERMLKKYPETLFIAHSHGWWRYIDSDVDNLPRLPTTPIQGRGRIEEILTKYPNAYCDLSGASASIALQRDLDFAKGFLTRHHEKILFGTDYLWGAESLALDYLEVLQVLDLEKEVFEAIAYKNALRILPAELRSYEKT